MYRFQLNRFFSVTTKCLLSLMLVLGVFPLNGKATSPEAFAEWHGGPEATWQNKAVAVGRDGGIAVVGTAIGDFRAGDGPNPTPAGGSDVFVALLDSTGTLQKLTYIGGSGNETALDVAISPDGLVAVSGRTESLDFPTSDGSGGNSFISVVDFKAREIVWSSRFEGKLAGAGFSNSNEMYFAVAESAASSRVGRLPFALRRPTYVEQITIDGGATSLFVGRNQFCVSTFDNEKSILSIWGANRPLQERSARKIVELPVIGTFGGWDSQAGVFWVFGKKVASQPAGLSEQAREFVPLEGSNGSSGTPISPGGIPKEIQDNMILISLGLNITAFTVTEKGPVAAGVDPATGSSMFWNLGLDGLARTVPIVNDQPAGLAPLPNGTLLGASPRSVRALSY